MEHICRQTYLFLALRAALSDLDLHAQSQQIEDLLVNILKNKIRSIVDDVDPIKKANKSSHILTCKQVCEKEFPLLSQNSNSMKYSSLIYDVKMSPTLMKQLRIKDSIIGQFELYSDQNLSRKEQKQLRVEKEEETVKKMESKHHKELKSKVQELIKTQKVEQLKKKKDEEKQRRKAAKEAQIKAARQELVKKRK